ncbi:MAG: hypothetical protein WA792_16180 [Pseudolabrys sp.]
MPHSSHVLRIFKYHALGNSYLILDPRRAGATADLFETSNCGEPRPTKNLVRMLCDMATGVGSNGLLFGPLPSSAGGEFGLFIINSDGTSAGFSGNGSRIFVQYLADAGDIHAGQAIKIVIPEENADGPVERNVAHARLVGESNGLIEVTAPHVPQFGAEAVAARAGLVREMPEENSTQTLRYSCPALAEIGTKVTGSSSAWATSALVYIGNPHCVTFVSEAGDLPNLETLQAHDPALRAIAFRGRSAEPVFANGINLQWAWPESRKRLRLMIYERGEGPTPASGSSACAAASAAFALGLVDNDVDVVMPGGRLAIRVEGTPADVKSVTLSGFATQILDGEVRLAPPET